MTTKRLYFVFMSVLALLFIGLVAGAYGANNLLAGQATKLTGLKAKEQALTEEQQSLVSAKKDIQKYGALSKLAKVIVPQDKSQAEAVREIVNLAAKNGISLASIAFPSSTLGNSPTGAAAGSTTTTVPVTAPTPASNAKSPANALSQLVQVKNIPGVYQLQITINNDTNHAVAYAPFINFLSALEHNRRTAQVSTINLQPSTTNANLFTFSLTLNEYIKP